MNTSNTFHSVAFDAIFTRPTSKPALVTLVDDTDTDDAGVDLEILEAGDDMFGETDRDILEAIVAAANR